MFQNLKNETEFALTKLRDTARRIKRRTKPVVVGPAEEGARLFIIDMVEFGHRAEWDGQTGKQEYHWSEEHSGSTLKSCTEIYIEDSQIKIRETRRA